MTRTTFLVEDSSGDVFLLRRAFKQAGSTEPRQVAVDGQQAIDCLDGKKTLPALDRLQAPFQRATATLPRWREALRGVPAPRRVRTVKAAAEL